MKCIKINVMTVRIQQRNKENSPIGEGRGVVALTLCS